MHNPDQKGRLEALGRLAGGIAHDLNNVLTGVLGHVSYLRLSLQGDAQQGESLKAIEDGARKAASMTQQILEFAKGEQRQPTAVNLATAVQEAVDLFKASLPPQIKLRFQAQSRDVFVRADAAQLNQLVLNLAANSRDALSVGGEIDISIERVSVTRDSRVQVPSLSPGRFAKLVVSDNGSGIPESVKDKIFEPFFTTKAKAGTGIGLATVISIVNSLGGAVHVESAEGEGSQFEIYLPECDEQQQPRESALVEDIPKGQETILVVDDEEAVRTVVQRCLEHLGYRVEVCGNGADAISRYQKNLGTFKLVILDMMMPQMAGDEVFIKLRQVDQHAPVLIASGYSSDSRARRVLDSGGLGFIQKPFAVEELAKEVRRCLDSKPANK